MSTELITSDCRLGIRDRSTANNGTMNERRYAMQDGNWNKQASTPTDEGGCSASAVETATRCFICDTTGSVGERYAYSAYGAPVFMTGAGTVQTSSPIGFETLYAGYRWDNPAPQMYYVRNRFLLPQVGTWNRRDPLGYVDGMSEYFIAKLMTNTDPFGLSVQPGLIVSPRTACANARKGLLAIGGLPWFFRNGSPEVQKLIQELSQQFPALLTLLGNSFSHWPGFTTDGSNGFVFTCGCGWIDLGHFWASALGGQSLGPSIAFYIGYLVEIIQKYGPGPESWRESEFTIEDLPSDLLGALFGAGFKQSDSNRIVSEFCDLLKKCGAVDVPKDKEGTLWRILQQEATYLSGEDGPSAWPTGPNDPVEPWRGKAHSLLCCGDYPGDCPGCSLQYVA